MTRSALPAQAANIKQAVGSWATCTPATAASLKACLLPTKPINIQERPSLSASKCPKSKPPKAQAIREVKKSKKKLGVEVTEVPLDGIVVLHVQDRWILATEVVNIILRALTDSIKNAPAKKIDCGNLSPTPMSCPVSVPESLDKETAVPLQPMSINRLSTPLEKPRRSKRSSSGSASSQRQGLRAQAECARIAFAALRSMHVHEGLGADMPPLQLENGMSALVGKLIAVGLDDLATKELRILKRRLDRNMRISAVRERLDLVGAKKNQADEASSPSKEPLESLIAFNAPIDRGGLLALVVTSQLQALKIIHALGNPDVIDASLKHLQLCCPYSPANLIDLQAEKTSSESKIKAARQLESLSQSLVALCRNLSTNSDGRSACPSPGTIFGLKVAVLEIRLLRWKLLAHENNIAKDIIEPFALYLDSFQRQSSLTPPEKYSIARIAYQRLFTSAEPVASSLREQLWLAVYNRLADLAQESGQPEEALEWLQYAMRSFPKKEMGSSKYCATSCRITNIRLEASRDIFGGGDLLISLKEARGSLKGDLRGEPADFDELLTIIFILRRSAFSVLHGYQNSISKTEPVIMPEAVGLCSDLLLLSLKFLVRYISSRSRNEKAGSRYNHRMQVIWNNARLFLESIAAMTRYSVAAHMHNWEELETGLRDCTWLVTTLADLQSMETSSSFGQDLKQLNFIPISNAYWCRYLYLKQKGGSSQEIRRSLHIAVDLLRSRPAEEKLSGLLPAKLETLGLLYEASKEYAKATDSYAEALRLFVQSNILKAAVVTCSRLPVAEVLGEPSEHSILGRLLLSYMRAASRKDSFLVEAKPYFDDESLPPGERGLLLEQQLIGLSLIIHKQGPSPNTCKMIQEISASLLTVYDNLAFPIRRLRVVLLLLQLRSSHPTAIDVNIADDIVEHRLQGARMASLESDSGLHRFGAHLLQCRDIYIAFLEINVSMQVLEENLALWSTMLQDATWDSVRNQVNDVAHWILQLEFLAEYLQMQGLDLLRVRTLQLIAILQDLREPVEPPAVVSSFSKLATLFTRLGYTTEAENALQKALKYSSSESSTETMISWNLASAELAINCGNIAKAEEQLTKACKIFKQTAESKNSRVSNFSRSLRTTQLTSDMNYVSSLVSTKKDEFPRAFLHARLHVKLGYRAWKAIECQQNKNTAGRLIGDDSSESDGDDVANPTSTLLLAKPDPPTTISPMLTMLQSVSFWSTARRLFDGLVHLSQLFAHWGLFSEGRYYMEQGLKIAEAVQAPCLRSQALSCLGDYLTRNGDAEKGTDLLKQAEEIRHNRHIDPHMASLQVFRANCYIHKKDTQAASEALEYAMRVLGQLMTAPFVKQSTSKPTAAQDLSAEMSQLSLHEGPVTRRLQTKARVASKKGASKSTVGVKATSSRGITIITPTISILSHLKATVLRQQASMAISMDKFELAASLLLEAANIPGRPQDLVIDKLGAGKLHLRQAIEAMAADPVFCVLPESTTSQPCISAVRGRQGVSASERSPKKKAPGSPLRSAVSKGASKDTRVGHAASSVRFLEFLGQAHESVLSVYEQAKMTCSTAIIHNMTDLLTRTIVMLSASTGSQAKGAANSMFALYVMELGKTLSMARANLAAQVEQQFSTHRPLLDWPARDIEDGIISTVEKTFDFSTFQSRHIDIIPSSWTVLSISLSESQDEIRVARVRSGQSPFILTLPLKRHNFRDPEEEYFGFKAARDELREIVNLANFSAHDAQDMTRKGARSEWWEVRAALDARLHDLLVNIENIWLGGFRGIFSQRSHSPELLSRFQQSLQNILNKHLPSRQKQGKGKLAGRVTLEPRVLELFVGLGTPTELNDLDEPLMDLLYFVIDILQFHGEHNAYDEIDFDSISIEIIDALRHYYKAANDEVHRHKSQHTILILDKALHGFPWESLPCLTEHAVSRLPSLDCLRDRILQQQQQQQQNKNQEPNRRNDNGLQVDRRSGAAILNPTSDLKATQAVFEPSLRKLPKWDLITQREPSEEEMKSGLETHSLFLYFGHGSGAQYIRSRTVKKLDSCAVALLMGCSSGVLTEAGEFEPYGTPINYIQGGCPALVANLWDVTDKDIDKFSFGALTAWGLFRGEEDKVPVADAVAIIRSSSPVKRSARQRDRGRNKAGDLGGGEQEQERQISASGSGPGSGSVPVSLDQAVAQSRDLCKLRYLNGAAPVVYGVPVFLV